MISTFEKCHNFTPKYDSSKSVGNTKPKTQCFDTILCCWNWLLGFTNSILSHFFFISLLLLLWFSKIVDDANIWVLEPFITILHIINFGFMIYLFHLSFNIDVVALVWLSANYEWGVWMIQHLISCLRSWFWAYMAVMIYWTVLKT